MDPPVLVEVDAVVVLATTARVVGVEAIVDTTTGVVDGVTCFADVLVVAGVALVVDVAPEVAVVATTATFVLPVSMATLYAETEKTASVPG